jgi:hypothetical protein
MIQNVRLETKPKTLPPVMQSVDRYENKKTNKYTKTKVYDYNINPTVAEDPY